MSAFFATGEIRPVDEIDVAVAAVATAMGMMVEFHVVSKKLEVSVPERGSMPETTMLVLGGAPISADPLFCKGYIKIGGVRKTGLISFSAAAGDISYVTGGGA